jgi:L-ascorbate metabolism protein UlaG (beta-lactamase superfamily)
MRLTKFGHACVRLEQDGRVLVIDPGVYSEAESLEGAGDVLVTHEHADHIDLDKLVAAREANPALTVYTHADLAGKLDRLEGAVITVAVGQTFTAAGFSVRVVGGEHAEIYDGLPGCVNVGFIIGGSTDASADASEGGSADGSVGGVYHPGDSVFVPAEPVHTLLVPASAPWLKLREAIDFVRGVAPERAFPIHDAMLSGLGLDNFDRWIDMKGNTSYARLPIGESVQL